MVQPQMQPDHLMHLHKTINISSTESDSNSESDDSDDNSSSSSQDSSENDSDRSSIEGVPGSSYGGYGYCYNCGRRGHWRPGCPFL